MAWPSMQRFGVRLAALLTCTWRTSLAEGICNPCVNIVGTASVIGEIPSNDGTYLVEAVQLVLAKETSVPLSDVDVTLRYVRSSFPATVLSFEFDFSLDVYWDRTRGQEIMDILELLTQAALNQPTPFAVQVRAAAEEHPLLSYHDTSSWLGRLRDIRESTYIISTPSTTNSLIITTTGNTTSTTSILSTAGATTTTTTTTTTTRQTRSSTPQTTRRTTLRGGTSTSSSRRRTGYAGTPSSSASTATSTSIGPMLSPASEESDTSNDEQAWLLPVILVFSGAALLLPALCFIWWALAPAPRYTKVAEQLRRLSSTLSSALSLSLIAKGVYTLGESRAEERQQQELHQKQRKRELHAPKPAWQAAGLKVPPPLIITGVESKSTTISAQEQVPPSPSIDSSWVTRSGRSHCIEGLEREVDISRSPQRGGELDVFGPSPLHRHSKLPPGRMASPSPDPFAASMEAGEAFGELVLSRRVADPGPPQERQYNVFHEKLAPPRIPAPPPIRCSPKADERQLRLVADANSDYDGTYSASMSGSSFSSMSLSVNADLRRYAGQKSALLKSASGGAARSRSPHKGGGSWTRASSAGRAAP